ncbi:MAG TPA: hypothetical protein VFL92_13585 [Sphingomonas sp.]|nr:hypothetical protein [Sphingomonas sp.]
MARGSSTPWFAAKRYGYGASLPIRWQGWAATLLFIAAFAAAARLLTGAPRWIAMAACIIVFLIVTAMKTEGGWRWRWGGR